MQLKDNELPVLIDLVYDLCGIALDDSKGYLLESRLSDIARDAGCQDYLQLVSRATNGSDPKLRSSIVDAITTHETLFFRDSSPFDALVHKALPESLDRASQHGGRPQLRIWSAACSTGQEPYSIAISILELLGSTAGFDIRILATDVSESSVERAREGTYSQLETGRGLPLDKQQRWFEMDGDKWRVKDQVRSMVDFRTHNLLSSPPQRGAFDIVFCRNVAIYFSPDDRKKIFSNITDSLKPEGYLFVGASENLADLGSNFLPQHHCRSVFYQPRSPQLAIR